MDQGYEMKHHALEESNWWFRARRDMVIRLVRGLRRDARILDVGCAGGSLLSSLDAMGFKDSYGIDTSERAVALCRKRGLGNVLLAAGGASGFPDARFDVVVASDVLEHIGDDDAALAEWHRILRPGGRLILFVPAFGFLWSAHDAAAHHHRRYSRGGLLGLVRAAGLRPSRTSYWNLSLFLPAAAFRVASGGRGKDQLYALPGPLNGLLEALLGVENRLLEHIDFPVGVSVFVVAEKPRG